MAFLGLPLQFLVADNLIRVHGVGLEQFRFGLGPGQSGTIGLFEHAGAPEVRLMAAYRPRDYSLYQTAPSLVTATLQDSVAVEITYDGLPGVACPVRVVKTGTTPQDFLITLTNDAGGQDACFFELYIRHH